MAFSDDEQIEVIPVSKYKSGVLIVAVGLFIISLMLTAFYTKEGYRTSLEAFAIGWLALFGGAAAFSWLANPFLVITWIQILRNGKHSWIPGILASIFASSFLFFSRVIKDESGNYDTITGIGLGYWLWFASCWLTFIGCITIRNRKQIV